MEVKYMMMMNVPGGANDYQINNWSPEDFKAHIAFMHQFNKDLKEAGEMVDAQGLAPPAQAKLIRSTKSGMPITDGIFPESKEFLAGYWIVDVESESRAIELAAKASSAPGPGGEPLCMAIELRQVMSAPPQS